MDNLKFTVGDRVKHVPRGIGTVIDINTTPGARDGDKKFNPNPSNPTEEAATGFWATQQGLYSGDRYPFLVKFDRDGYTDVYSEQELKSAEEEQSCHQ